MANFCKNCGKKLGESQKFCSGCGTKAEEDNNLTSMPQNVSESITSRNNTYQNLNTNTRKKRGGCLKIVGIIFAVFVIGIGVLLFGGKDDDVSNSDMENLYTENDFYNIKTIPVIENNEELTENNLPFVIRGLCELRLDAMNQTEILYSKDFIEASAKEEILDKSNEVLKLWSDLEEYSDKFRNELEGFEFASASDKGRLDILGFIGVNEAYAYTPNEIVALYDQAGKIDKVSRLRRLAEHLGVTARDAHKIVMKATQEISEGAGEKADWLEIGERALRLARVAGKVCEVGLAVSTGGASSLITGPCAIITGTDMLLSVGSDASFVIFGDNPTVKSFVAPIDKFRDKIAPITGIASLMSFSFDVSSVAAKGSLFINSFNISVEAFQGKFCGIDFSSGSDDNASAQITGLKKEDINAYVKDKGLELKLDESKIDADDSEDYSGLDTDVYIGRVNKRQEELKEKQQKLSSNMDKTLKELEAMMSYDYDNAGGNNKKAIASDKNTANNSAGEKSANDNKAVEDTSNKNIANEEAPIKDTVTENNNVEDTDKEDDFADNTNTYKVIEFFDISYASPYWESVEFRKALYIQGDNVVMVKESIIYNKLSSDDPVERAKFYENIVNNLKNQNERYEAEYTVTGSKIINDSKMVAKEIFVHMGGRFTGDDINEYGGKTTVAEWTAFIQEQGYPNQREYTEVVN